MYNWLWQAFRAQRFVLCYTTEMLQEYEEKLAHYYSVLFAENVMNEILNAENVERVTIFYKWNLITADPDDNKFVDCAIAAGAQYIVTNDKHFNVLHQIKFPKVQVADISMFKQIITGLG
ncbi:hypothetical protein AGMMS4956_02020 [Bacteroidia bacterium]|nr:hypothetical protein AGMMS4956_02020 [Bacteroidia bacterium]